MKIYLIILVSLEMATSSYGQVNHMHEGQKESIYEKAIKELVKETKDEGPIYISNEKYISNFIWAREIEGRKIIFISNVNEQEELKINGNLIRVYEIEYPLINEDQLQIKINHMTMYEIDLLKSENEWPKKLTDKEREVAHKGIEKSKLVHPESETYSSLVNNGWTYVIFRFDTQGKEFKLESIETEQM